MSSIIKINGVDVSKYIQSQDEVPYSNRNRDYEIIAQGFTFVISNEYLTTIENGDIVTCEEGIKIFYGYVLKSTPVIKDGTYEIEVKNYLSKFQDKIIDDSIRIPLIHGLVAVDDPGTVFTAAPGQEFLYSPGHTLVAGDRILLRGSDLPAPLISDYLYWVGNYDTNGFDIYNNYEDFDLGNYIAVTDSGTGTHTFHIPDLTKFNDYDNLGFPYVALQYLIEKLFEIRNMQIDFTEIDGQQLYLSTGSASLDFLKLDYNMLLAINQSTASNVNEAINQISFFDFISAIFGMFGLCIVYEGDGSAATFKIYPQEYQSVSDPQPYYPKSIQPVYTFDNNFFIKESQPDMTHVERSLYAEFYYADRIRYASSIQEELTLHGSLFFGTLRDKEDISFYNNLVIFDTPDLENPETVGLPLPLIRMCANRIIAGSYSYETHDILTQLLLSEPTIKSEFIDMENEISHIIQEVNIEQEITQV